MAWICTSLLLLSLSQLLMQSWRHYHPVLSYYKWISIHLRWVRRKLPEFWKKTLAPKSPFMDFRNWKGVNQDYARPEDSQIVSEIILGCRQVSIVSNGCLGFITKSLGDLKISCLVPKDFLCCCGLNHTYTCHHFVLSGVFTYVTKVGWSLWILGHVSTTQSGDRKGREKKVWQK